MQLVKDYVGGLELGDLRAYRNIAIVPLIGSESDLEYLVLGDAIGNGLEVEETQHVPTLGLENKTGKEVLIVPGEYVKGGSQNRMMAVSSFLKDRFKGSVPVRCGQVGRWDGGMAKFRSDDTTAPASVKTMTSYGQREVWDNVDMLCESVGVKSSTKDVSDVYAQKRGDIEDYVRQFSFEPGSIGIIVATQRNGNLDYGVELFDRSGTMEKHFEKLIGSYVADVISRDGKFFKSEAGLRDDMGVFLKSSNGLEFIPHEAVSLGENYGLLDERAEGVALAIEDQPLYVSYASTDAKGRDELERRKTQISKAFSKSN